MTECGDTRSRVSTKTQQLRSDALQMMAMRFSDGLCSLSSVPLLRLHRQSIVPVSSLLSAGNNSTRYVKTSAITAPACAGAVSGKGRVSVVTTVNFPVSVPVTAVRSVRVR